MSIASRSRSSELRPCDAHSRVSSSMARGLPRDAPSIRSVGGSPRLASPPVATSATSRAAASGPSGSSSSGRSASRVESVTSAAGAAAVWSSPGRPVRISSSRVRGSLRATMWRIAALALSDAWMSSTTSTIGVSSAAASVALRNESASRSGITSAVHWGGLGTPGNTWKISGDTRDSSANASGSAPPIARCSASCFTSSASTANGSSRSASYAWARATTAPSI